MQKTQVHLAGFSLLLSQPSASSLVWIVGLTLLLFAANAYAGQVSLAWDAVSTSNLGAIDYTMDKRLRPIPLTSMSASKPPPP